MEVPEAGQQVPAGGVNTNEDLPTAVLREVTEETGLAGLTIVRALTTEDKPHRSFITRRRALRPGGEYRDPTPQEWAEFEQHFTKRKVELGTCARPYG
ncbi:MAG TPA: NUDIX domain-containing protein, partial [Kribbella sp.]